VAEATSTSAANAPLEVALRIPATRISPAGLAYDHVSGRFLIADSSSDKLVSVDELSRHMVDLVKADSAGFRDITAFEIDTRRGDLWVVSAGRPGGTDHESATALHKLQLVSGRPLAKFQPGDGFGDTRFEDVAVAKSGDVFALDAAGGRVFRLAPRTTMLKMACRLRLDHPVSLAIAGDRAAVAYVAYARGLVRVNLATGSATRVAASKSLRLDGLERIRFDSGHIVATQRGEDGTRHVVSIQIAGGTSPRATAVERLDGVAAVAGGTLTALSGDDVYFLTREAGHDGEDGEFVVQRARVR
jgi:glucose/arabinose dehydrogenase